MENYLLDENNKVGARIKFLQLAHQKLNEHVGWYSYWHKNPNHRPIHYLALAGSLFGVIIAFFVLSSAYPAKMAFAPSVYTAYDPNTRMVYNPSVFNQEESTQIAILPEALSGNFGENEINSVQLFDIRLNLQNNLLTKASELIALVRFESFGNVPTTVDLTYRILDSLNKEVYLEKGNIIVETEQLLTKEFKNLNLTSGKYTLILTTTYGNNITDEFRQGFEVGDLGVSKENTRTLIIILLALFGLVSYFIYKKKSRQVT